MGGRQLSITCPQNLLLQKKLIAFGTCNLSIQASGIYVMPSGSILVTISLIAVKFTDKCRLLLALLHYANFEQMEPVASFYTQSWLVDSE